MIAWRKRLAAQVIWLVACLPVYSVGAQPGSIEECAELMEAYAVEQPEPDASVECPIPVELPSLYELCPEQVAVLLQDPWSRGLARDTEELVLGDLTGLSSVRQNYTGRTAADLVNTADVAGVLAGLDLPPPESASLWQQFLRWVQEWFENEDPDFSVFETISISDATLKTIMYSAIGLIILLAILIVGGELRLALRGRRHSGSFGWENREAERTDPLDFERLLQAPLREQPGLLLQIILAQLTARGILRLRTSCTHRDICAAASTLALGDDLGEISTAAERATFGDWCPAEKDMAALLETGRGVLLTIEGTTR